MLGQLEVKGGQGRAYGVGTGRLGGELTRLVAGGLQRVPEQEVSNDALEEVGVVLEGRLGVLGERLEDADVEDVTQQARVLEELLEHLHAVEILCHGEDRIKGEWPEWELVLGGRREALALLGQKRGEVLQKLLKY